MTQADTPRRVSSSLRSTVRRTRTRLTRVAISATVRAQERADVFASGRSGSLQEEQRR